MLNGKWPLATVAENPETVLTIWRQERAYRVGKVLCFIGFFLSLAGTVADFFWSAPSVLAMDFVLLAGCATSGWLVFRRPTPYFFWPIFLSFWISVLPSFWTTGGINSPFLGVGIIALYSFGAILDGRNGSMRYFIFAMLHLPVLLAIEYFVPLTNAVAPKPELSAVILGATIAGIIGCILAVLRTERELSREFSDREGQLREAQSIARMGSWEWDVRANKVIWSDELFRIFQVDKKTFDPTFEAYLGRLAPSRRDEIHEMIKNTLATGDEFTFDNQITSDTGLSHIHSRGRAVKDEHGKVIRLVGTCQDITDRKLIESLLVEARDKLEARVEERTVQLAASLEREKAAKELAEYAGQAKMQFLANMSHEIRTPMNSILGFSELLATDCAEADRQEYLARIRKNGSLLLHLIDDILDLSKFEAGRIPLQLAPVSLESLLEDVAKSFSPLLQSKGLKLDIEYAGEIPDWIESDSHRLNQIVTNLLSNAIKFSERGEVKVRVSCGFSTSRDENRLSIDVEDCGIGISKENRKNLFQPFRQGDSSIARKFGGTGLGLALSKRIAEALGGSLELVASQPGVGSHFRFEIPFELVNAAVPVSTASPIAATTIGRERHILLVEDSPDNALLICHYLKESGAKIDVAIDGIQAVKMAKDKTYDCILMDIQMPGMDGLEATRRIRENGYTAKIVALTAHALANEAVRSVEAGCNLHLTKPISQTDLLSALAREI